MNNKNELKYLKGGKYFYITLIICLIVFLNAITFLISAFNRLIVQHDEKLSGEICTIVSEKMSNSLLFMTDSALEVSSVLSAQKFDSPEEIYEVLKDYKGAQIISIGFIDENGAIYSSESEKEEFEKWNLLETAHKASPVSVSAPYRSKKIGQPVITFFTDFEYGTSKHGYMFMTYLFSSLQEVAATQSLTNDIEIWLMDAKSSNIIQCVGSDEHASGSWANAYLAMQNINPEDKADFDRWHDKMDAGATDTAVSYKIEDTIYSQFCSAIEYMPGWYVVVRIPGNVLSITMQIFRNYVILFIVVLLVIVFILVSIMYISGKRENRMLSQLSINDPLTGVLNRRAFELAAEQMLSESKEAAVVFFDIDYFKQVNDAFGHDTGDKLLVAFSDALKKNFPEDCLVSRYGGDEFIVLINMKSKEQVTERLKQTKEDVHAINLGVKKGKDAMISFSAGVASYPKDASSLSDLQKCADTALYTVKERGRNAYLWYSSSLDK